MRTFINRTPFFKRLAVLLEKGTSVSFEDQNMYYESSIYKVYMVNSENLLEINNRSVLKIFPESDSNFPYEVARQARLQSKSQAPDGRPVKTVLANAQPAVIPQHFRRQGRA
jgi:hypothetical protein